MQHLKLNFFKGRSFKDINNPEIIPITIATNPTDSTSALETFICSVLGKTIRFSYPEFSLRILLNHFAIGGLTGHI